jgi:hypothetical protein
VGRFHDEESASEDDLWLGQLVQCLRILSGDQEEAMHIWREIGPELLLGLYLVAWGVMLLVTHLLSR